MRRRQLNITALLVITALLLSSFSTYAAGSSPFVGHWEAIDADGSDIRMAIGGPPTGPFQITWTESYISFCDGEAGIVRGTGILNTEDPNFLEADLVVDCLQSGLSMEFHLTFRYHANTETLSTSYDGSSITVFTRPGKPHLIPDPIGLRVNYGHEWVESFYPAGHTVWIAITEEDGLSVKATAEVMTEPRDEWEGESGFQIQWDQEELDIMPYDWVYAWVDNGAIGQVQLGEISGMFDFETDSVEGSINASWFGELVEVECHPWGSPDPLDMQYGSVLPDGAEGYSCGWEGWNFQPGEELAVAYTGPDGHWVANVFTGYGNIVASETGDFIWFSGFVPFSDATLTIYESMDESAPTLWSDVRITDEGGFAIVEPAEHEQDLEAGNYIVVEDGSSRKGLLIEHLTMDVFDITDDVVSGDAPPESALYVVAATGSDAGEQNYMWVEADGSTGFWSADFSSIEPFGLTDYMRGWSFVQLKDDDEDSNEAGTPPYPAPPRILAQITDDWFEAQEFTPGAPLEFWIYKSDGISVLLSGTLQADDNGTAGIWVGDEVDLAPGHQIVVTDGEATKTLVLEDFTFEMFDLAQGTLTGNAPEPRGRLVWVGIGFEEDGWSTELFTDEAGSWYAEYGGPVPTSYQWVAAQVFDADGDASELRPDQIEGLWVAAFTTDFLPESVENGTYPYHFNIAWSAPEQGSWSGQGGDFTINSDADTLDGYVLLRGPIEVFDSDPSEGLDCTELTEINPNQPIRFVFGWLNEYGMNYDDAIIHFGSLSAEALWGEADAYSVPLTSHPIQEFSFDDLGSWFNFVCSFTH